MVQTQEHWEALTSILLFTDQSALEKLRYMDHRSNPFPETNASAVFA
jgi:hypothetical protein